MTQQEVKVKLIKAGVNNLREFGYESATPQNIMSDEVYAMFFKSMLKDNLGQIKSLDPIINGMIAEIDDIHN